MQSKSKGLCLGAAEIEATAIKAPLFSDGEASLHKLAKVTAAVLEDS